MKKFEKVEKTGIISTKFSLRCTPSVILGFHVKISNFGPPKSLCQIVHELQTNPYGCTFLSRFLQKRYCIQESKIIFFIIDEKQEDRVKNYSLKRNVCISNFEVTSDFSLLSNINYLGC